MTTLVGLDPLFWTFVRVFIKDILSLQRQNEIFYFQTHPIRFVLISGIIIGRDLHAKFINYIIDDGTGLVSCIQWFKEEEEKHTFLALGDFVTLQGRLADYQDERQIVIDSIALEKDPNMEWFRWIEIIKYRQEALERPFVPEEHSQHIVQLGLPSLDTDSIEQKPFSELYKEAFNQFLTEKDLVTLLLAYFQEQTIDFSFSQFIEFEFLKPLVQHVFQCQYNTLFPSHQRILALYKRLLFELTQKGMIYLDDSENDLYKVFTTDSFEKSIMETLCMHPLMPSETLFFTLKSQSQWENVSRTVFNQCLNHLKDEGMIFDCGQGKLRCM